MKVRKKFILQKNVYGTKQKIFVFNIANYFLLKELELANSFYGNNINESNKADFLKTIKDLSLREAKLGVYLSPLMALDHKSTFNFCITENDISSIFNFMVIKLLPIFKLKGAYIAILLHDIYRTDWQEDESGYAKGSYFLRDFLTKNSISSLIKKTEFSAKFMNYLFQKINWCQQINRQKNFFSSERLLTKKQYDQSRNNWESLGSDNIDFQTEGNEIRSLFKNATLSANMGADLNESMQFQSYAKFEDSIKNIYRFKMGYPDQD